MQQSLDQLFEGAISSGGLAGVSAIVCSSQGNLFEGAYGRRGVDTSTSKMSLDTVGAIMSMTKALTGTAVMQLVENGRIKLDQPAGLFCPPLGEVQVFAGYDANGEALLRPPIRPVTLRHLLTHTSGFVYEIWNKPFRELLTKMGLPSIATQKRASLEVPLMFDPGERWEYGIGIDWVGQIVEAVSGMTLGEYFTEYITGPLGMTDTAFQPNPTMIARMAPILGRINGKLTEPPKPTEKKRKSTPPEIEMGGGGLLSTTWDYARFLRMILNNGSLGDATVLQPETVAQMRQNQMGDLRVTRLPTANPMLSNDAELFPGDAKSWGLTFQVSEEPGFTGRPKGTLMWAGLHNCYYWIDSQNDLAGIFFTQVLPFADPECLDVYYQFESQAYSGGRPSPLR
jgi:methyl acetate hydrolase